MLHYARYDLRYHGQDAVSRTRDVSVTMSRRRRPCRFASNDTVVADGCTTGMLRCARPGSEKSSYAHGVYDYRRRLRQRSIYDNTRTCT